MKLLGCTKNKITEDKIGGNVPHLETTEVVLVHSNFIKNDYQKDSRVLYKFIPNQLYSQLLDIHQKIDVFENLSFRIFIIWSMVYWSKF